MTDYNTEWNAIKLNLYNFGKNNVKQYQCPSFMLHVNTRPGWVADDGWHKRKRNIITFLASQDSF